MTRSTPTGRLTGLAAAALTGALTCGLLVAALPSAHAEETATPVSAGRVVDFGSTVTAPEITDAVAVAASDTREAAARLAVRANGSVVAWGDDRFGVGEVPALDDAAAVDVTAGLAVALTRTGSVVAWGDNRSGGLDVPADLGTVKEVAVAGSVTADGPCNYGLALTEAGTVVRWGQSDPTLACFDMSLDAPEGLDDVVDIAANARGAMALKADGTVVTWGRWFGTRWDGVAPTTWTDVTQISMGAFSALGLREDGSVASYGIWGESGPGLNGPAEAVSAGRPELALRADGGITAYYQATAVPQDLGFQAVAAGDGFGLAIAAASEEPGGPTDPCQPDPNQPDPDPTDPGPTDPGSDKPALGTDKVQPYADSNRAGTAEAFRVRARDDLRARQLKIYLDRRSTARTVIVGVYTDRRGKPGRLVSTGRSSDLTRGWNSIAISRVDIEDGQTYWLSVLTPMKRGTVVFRDLPDGRGGPTVTSAQTRLTAKSGLPVAWKTGRHYGNAPASMYLL